MSIKPRTGSGQSIFFSQLSELELSKSIIHDPNESTCGFRSSLIQVYIAVASMKSLILQAPNAITKKSLGDRAGCVQHPKFETIGSLKSTTPTSTKTSPQNITLHYRKFLAVWPSRSRLTMWPKYPKNKLVRAVSEQK